MDFVSAVPAGLEAFPTGPGIEMPGYFQLFLRNRTPALVFAGAAAWDKPRSGDKIRPKRFLAFFSSPGLF
jgi:hypothetical protein